jgi:L-iditol 2-dehydrogenase
VIKKGKLLRLTGKNRVEICEEEIPEVKEDGMLVKINLAGICGTEIHIIENADRPEFINALPMVMGHEVVGKIVDIGGAAQRSMYCDTDLKVGDKVSIYVFLPCGNCWWERKFGTDHTLICDSPPPGYFLNSDKWPYFVAGWAEYMYIQPGTWIWKVPDWMSDDIAVLTEPFSMGIRAVEKALSLPAWKNMQTLSFGGTAVVLGSGAIGILTAIAAKIAGAGVVVLSGAPSNNLQIAKEIGAADEIVNILETTPEERLEKVKQISDGGHGADVVFEAAGEPNAFCEALEMTRKLGTVVEMGCLIDDGRNVSINVARNIVQKDITIYGVTNQPPQYFTKSLTSLGQYSDRFDFSRIVTHRFSLEDFTEAIELTKDHKRRGIKTVLIGNSSD